MIQENEQNRKAKDLEKKRQFEQEQRDIKEYEHVLDEQERKRAEDFRAKEARIQAFLKFTADTVVKKDEGKRRDDERKLLNHLLEKEKRDKEDEERRKREHRYREQSMKSYLDEQVKHKRETVATERTKNRELAANWRREAEDFMRQEAAKSQETRRRYREVSKEVLRQIAERKDSRSKEEEMSGLEFALNKKLVDTVAKSSREAGCA